MTFDFSTNIAQFTQALEGKSAAVPRAVKKSLVDATTVFYSGALRRMGEMIYNVAIPVLRRFRRHTDTDENGNTSFRKAAKGKNNFFGFSHSKRQSNRPAWRRTGTLRRGERAYFDKLDQFETRIDNQTPYTKARHDLNKPSPVDGKTRRAPWREQTAQEDAANAMASFEAALKAGLLG